MLETIATVESNQILSPSYGRLTLHIDKAMDFLAGQFVMVRPAGIFEPILRRALAVYRTVTRSGGTSFELVYQVFGRGLDQLMRVREGDAVECLGPLGNSFVIPQGSGRDALIIAGGIGSAALFMIAEQLKSAGNNVYLFFGAGTKSALIGLEDFQEIGIETTISTDDGSAGFHGRITEAVEQHLKKVSDPDTVIYTCGPYPMMRRVSEIAESYRLTAYVSLETRMACGFGVCVGCVHPIKTGPSMGFTYKRVCVEGPVFSSNEVVW